MDSNHNTIDYIQDPEDTSPRNSVFGRLDTSGDFITIHEDDDDDEESEYRIGDDEVLD